MVQDKGRKLGGHESQENSFESDGLLEGLRGLGEKALDVVKRVRGGVVSTVKPLGSALTGAAALGAVGAASLPTSADAEAFVTAGANPGNGQIYVVQDVPQGGNVTVTPDVYDVPIPAGATVFGSTRIDDSHFVRGVSIPAEQRAETQILELDGTEFVVTSTLPTTGHYSVLLDGNVLITNYYGLFKFDPNNPQGTLEQIIESDVSDDNLYAASASFVNNNGDQCFIVPSGANLLLKEGDSETLIPIPPEVLLGGIFGLRIGDGQLVINNGGRAYTVPFDPNNPQALIDDIQDAVLVHEATVDSINDAVHGVDYYAVAEGDNIAIYSKGISGRNDIDILGQQGFVQDGNVLHVAGWDPEMGNSIFTIDPATKEVVRTISADTTLGLGITGGLAVLSGDPELEALTELPPIGNMHMHESGPGYTVVEGPEESSVALTVDLASLETPGDSISIPFMSVLDSGPEHSIYVTLTYDTIPLGGSLDPIILGGTGGYLTSTNVDGNVFFGLTIGKDGRLGTSSGVFQGAEVTEGSADNTASYEVGSYADIQAEATSGDDDDASNADDDDPVDDDTVGEVPGGCANTGCTTLKNGDTKNLGNIAILLAAAGLTGTRRKKAMRRAARRGR